MQLNEYQSQKRRDYITGLKRLVDLYENNELMPAPACSEAVSIFAENLQHFLELRRSLGMHDKYGDDDWLSFRREITPMLKICLHVNKAKTCQRVLVGEKVVPASPEIRIPATPERVEKEYRWVCPESLLDAANGQVAEEATA